MVSAMLVKAFITKQHFFYIQLQSQNNSKSSESSSSHVNEE